MAGPLPNGIRTSDLKSRFLNLSQTSVFQVKISPPPAVTEFLGTKGVNFANESPNLELLCKDVDLPGSNLQTFDVVDNYSGVTESMVERRDFGQTLRMSFFVDRNYKVVDIFDGWHDYISNQRDPNAFKDEFVAYRMNYPSGATGYRGQVFITKFEKDAYGTANSYTLIGAYPKALISTPVSYSQSQLMEYTVTFSFLRYVRERVGYKPDDNAFFENGALTPEFFANANRNLSPDGNTRPGTAN